jgi:hypothetical protein
MLVPISDYAFLDLDAPTVSAWEFIRVNGSTSWLVSELWHEHGPAEGHRIAHWRMPTPYTATGYNLAFAGEWWEAFQ